MGLTDAMRKMREFRACVPIFQANIDHFTRFDLSGGSAGPTIESEFADIFDILQRARPGSEYCTKCTEALSTAHGMPRIGSPHSPAGWATPRPPFRSTATAITTGPWSSPACSRSPELRRHLPNSPASDRVRVLNFKHVGPRIAGVGPRLSYGQEVQRDRKSVV